MSWLPEKLLVRLALIVLQISCNLSFCFLFQVLFIKKYNMIITTFWMCTLCRPFSITSSSTFLIGGRLNMCQYLSLQMLNHLLFIFTICLSEELMCKNADNSCFHLKFLHWCIISYFNSCNKFNTLFFISNDFLFYHSLTTVSTNFLNIFPC